MKSFTCTGILKNDENGLPSYELQDHTGEKLQISYQKLKLMLKSNKIHVVNLMLENDEIIFSPPSPIYSMLIKSRVLNCCDIIETVYNSNIYVIELSPAQHIIYISSGVKAIWVSTLDLSKFKGYLKKVNRHANDFFNLSHNG